MVDIRLELNEKHKRFDFSCKYVKIKSVIKMIDITPIFKKYEKKWIALTDDDKVICVGKTLDEVMKEAKRRGFSEPVTMKVPDSRIEFVMYVQPN